MTENTGGAPRDPERDAETPPTQPLEPMPGTGAAPGDETAAETAQYPPQEAPRYPAQDTPSEPAPAQPGGYGASGGYAAPAAPVAAQGGWTPAPPKNDLGVWALVTGILSYVMCPLVLGVAAIVTGTMSRRAADQGLANNRGMGTAGLILGWINVGLVLLGIAFFVVAIAAGLLSGGFADWGDMNDVNRYSDY